MSIQGEIIRINNEVSVQANLIEQIQMALENKAAGGGGITLPALDNPASASDILSGKEAINGSGTKITGTITTKTASNLTASGATVTVPAGYYASQVTKSVSSGSAKTPATTVTKNPTISVSSSGLITASVSGTQNVTPTVTAGYVSSGTAGTITVSGSATKQLTTKAATTYTPSTSNQTIASDTYLTGTQTIAGDANLVAGNIKSGVSIFGVAGSYEGSGGGSSGGGSTESCTITITPDVFASPESPFYYYTDAATLTIKCLSTQDGTIIVPKNTILVITGWSSYSIASGSCVQIFYAAMNAAYQITGDCSFTYCM